MEREVVETIGWQSGWGSVKDVGDLVDEKGEKMVGWDVCADRGMIPKR